MSRPLRNTNPECFRLITIRIDKAKLLMLPDDEVNKIIGGVIARYQELFSITIFAYIFLSNHYHVACQAPEGMMWRFEQAVNREIAKRINVLRKTWGHFWHRRYDEQQILTHEDLLEAILYITCNAVSHGLVHHPKHWPGLNCYWHLLDEQDRVFTFTHYAKYRKACKEARGTGTSVRKEDFQTTHTLKLSPLPQLTGLSQEERASRLKSLIAERVLQIHEERKSQGQGFLNRKFIRTQDPFSTPKTIKKSPRPDCYTKDFEAKKIFTEWLKSWCALYDAASIKFRQGFLNTEFPEFCIRPPLLYMLSPP